MAADRNSSGQFVKGCKTGGARAGSGAKPLIQRELLDKAVSESQWVEIYSTMRIAAIGGDVRAANFLDERRWGKPKERIEETDSGIQPLNTIFHVPQMQETEESEE